MFSKILLACVIRSAKDFRNTDTLFTLFNRLVQTKVEYVREICNPYFDVHSDNIDYVQKRFLKYLSFKIDSVYPRRGSDYLRLCQPFNILTFAERRIIHCRL